MIVEPTSQPKVDQLEERALRPVVHRDRVATEEENR
jgi:hypothetical protein